MSAHPTEEPHSFGKRGMVLLAALAATVAMVFGMAAGPVSSANAETFCGGVTLGPNGQCHLPVAQAQDIFAISSYSAERANCVALLGYYGEQLDSWVCAKAGASPWYVTPLSKPFGFYRAAVKNNSLSQSGKFNGYVYCCNPHS
jgi:hypothetical protein